MTGTVPWHAVSGLSGNGEGATTISGPLLALADALDRRFVELSRPWEAVELRFPPLIAAADLERVDWFRSFPQLATFPVCLRDDPGVLERFTGGEPVSAQGQVELTEPAPVREVLTPAACYHLYAHHRGERFDGPRYFTTKSTCFRRESSYVPLERQWSFTMREVVCMGTAAETRAFLDEATSEVDRLAAEVGVEVGWALATDPFFRPSRNPAYLMQRIDPTKHELLFDGRLAIASTNLHHDHFGRAFGIERTDGSDRRPVHTACVAFGVERWLAAIIGQFGPDEGGWPAVAG